MILVLGAGGQIGREVSRSLAPLAPLTLAMHAVAGEVRIADRDASARDVTDGASAAATARVCIDLARTDDLGARLDALAPTIIVNAAAYTAVDRAEEEPELADAINHRAVAVIAGWAARNQALLLHYSTDYVFAGDADTPYAEDAATAPLSVYGRSKWAGEEAIRESSCAHLIVRTAWVYAAHGNNFLRSMLGAARAQRTLRVVADQIGTPTSARFLAAASAQLLARCTRDDRPGLRETLHLTAAGSVSWHGYATHLLTRAVALGLLAQLPDIEPIPSAAWPTRATRPSYSVLDCRRIAALFGIHCPHWHDELDATLRDLAAGRFLIDAP